LSASRAPSCSAVDSVSAVYVCWHCCNASVAHLTPAGVRPSFRFVQVLPITSPRPCLV
jgi:hypothetical protein